MKLGRTERWRVQAVSNLRTNSNNTRNTGISTRGLLRQEAELTTCWNYNSTWLVALTRTLYSVAGVNLVHV
jgi:hypothetical protein